MTTRADLVTIIRNQGIDATTWTATEVNQWIADGIGEYSQHYPRTVHSAANACTASQHEYTLPTDWKAAWLVEYPEGQTPRCYLDRLDEHDERFGPGYYDIRLTKLILGEGPAAGDKYGLVYQAVHDFPDTDATVLTLADEDLEIIVQYVIWKAYRRLELDQAKLPDSSTVLLSMLGTNTGRAYRDYETMLRTRKRASGQYAGWGKE